MGGEFFDTDQLIEAQEGCTVTEIFASHGEAHFRTLERQLLDRLPETDKTIVFGTGGGLPVFNDNIHRLAQIGSVVALSASLEVLCNRLKNNQDRPLLAASGNNDADNDLREKLSELVSTRSPVYALAGYKIDTSGLSPDEVAHEIVQMLKCDALPES